MICYQYDPTKETMRITDKMGFVYEVTINHCPQHGFSTAYYEGKIIGQVELGKLREPFSDDDRDWERYEEEFEDWKCEINANMILICQEYFNKTKQ